MIQLDDDEICGGNRLAYETVTPHRDGCGATQALSQRLYERRVAQHVYGGNAAHV